MIPEDYMIKRQASTQFYFKIGSVFESLLVEAFEKQGILIADELRVEAQHEDVPVSGRIDFVLMNEEGNPIIMELKSCGKLPSSPKPHHLAQIQSYMLFTGQSEGLLWYISRNVSDFSGKLKQKVFTVTMNDEQKFQIAKTIALGVLYSDSELIPPKPEHMKKYKCGFCPLIPHCWEDQNMIPDFFDPEMEDHIGFVKSADTIAEEMIEAQESYNTYFHFLLASVTGSKVMKK